ncbi:tripartite tricarboxylate transporter TctB family protein [Propylenella binzhouense]|nr:tripartite tricarboxylate transporter TctB family protein [Propylenella binzhouense]
MRLTVTRDLLAGLLFLGLGGGAALMSSSYRFGTILRMGPGFFPVTLGLMVALIGLVVTARAIVAPDGSPPVGTIRLRPVLLVSASVVVFALLVERLGLAAAVAALVVVGSLAGPGLTVRGAVAKVVVLVAIAVAIFVYGLAIPFKVWPW